MDEVKVDKPSVSYEEKLLEYKERRENRRNAVIVFLTIPSIIAATIIILAWSPWN